MTTQDNTNSNIDINPDINLPSTKNAEDSPLSRTTQIHSIDWGLVLERLSHFATSSQGKRELENLHPLSSPQAALKSFAQIGEAATILQTKARPFMESLDVYEAWWRRLAKKAILKTSALKDIRHFCMEVIALKETLANETPSSSWSKEQKSQLMNAKEPISAIDDIITPSGDLRSDASKELYELNNEKSNLTKSIQKTLDRRAKAHQMEPLLQDKYVTSREGRWVLPIKSGVQHRFDGIIHASSQSQKTVFMEPSEIVPMNNRLRQIESEIEEEVQRILSELSSYLHGLLIPFQRSQATLLHCDITFAKARLRLQIKGNPCQFSEDQCHLMGLRHPFWS